MLWRATHGALRLAATPKPHTAAHAMIPIPAGMDLNSVAAQAKREEEQRKAATNAMVSVSAGMVLGHVAAQAKRKEEQRKAANVVTFSHLMAHARMHAWKQQEQQRQRQQEAKQAAQALPHLSMGSMMFVTACALKRVQEQREQQARGGSGVAPPTLPAAQPAAALPAAEEAVPPAQRKLGTNKLGEMTTSADWMFTSHDSAGAA